MNHRDRDDEQGRRGGRDARGQRDTYNPEPQWLRDDRDQQRRTWGSGRDDELEYGQRRSEYAGHRGGRDMGGRDYDQRLYGGWENEDNLDLGPTHESFDPFRVGTGMGTAFTGRTRPEFGRSYGTSSGYGSRSGYDLGTQQRDYVGERGRQQSYRGMGPQHYKRSDERIRDDIYERLTDSAIIDARFILVDVSEGNVTITGTVGERRMRYAAEDLVERVGGVTNIDNQLRVERLEPAASASTSASTPAKGGTVIGGTTPAKGGGESPRH